MKIQTIIKRYVEKDHACDTERTKINKRIMQRENQIKRLNTKLERLGDVSWIDEIIEPIAKEMVKLMPDRYYDILGPFGITCTTTIHLYKNGTTDKNRFKRGNCKSISFRPKDLSQGEIVIVDYTHDTKEFGQGTTGEMNGMNYPTIPMKKTITELVNFTLKP